MDGGTANRTPSEARGQATEWDPEPNVVEQIWARRAAELAEVPPAEREGEQVEMLLVRLADEVYAFEAQYGYDVRPAGRIARLPHVPPWVAGVTSLRGRIQSVLDLGRFLGLPAKEPGGDRSLVVVSSPTMELALLVDKVLSVESLPLDRIQEADDALHGISSDYVWGVAERPGAGDQGLLIVLDLPALLSDERVIIDQDLA